MLNSDCAVETASNTEPVRTAEPVTNIVFIDSEVSDIGRLTDGLPEDAVLVLLRDGKDPMAQISDALDGHVGLQSVHIVSHGRSGELRLGGSRVTAKTLNENQQIIESWRTSLGANADILIYGCEVGRSSEGAAFLQLLAQLTGADVAGSTNVTGTAPNADWHLEYTVGAIDTAVAFPVETRKGYLHTFMNVTPEGNFEAGTGFFYGTGSARLFEAGLARSGSLSAGVFNRAQSTDGLGRNLLGVLEEDQDYKVSLWVRLTNSAPEQVAVGIAQTDGRGTRFETLRETTVTSNGWTQFSGGFRLETVGNLSGLELYVIGPQPAANFVVDDVVIEPYDWRSDVDNRIEQVRKQDVSVLVIDQNGTPIPTANITALQNKSSFGFGTAVNDVLLTDSTYSFIVASEFNQATIEDDAQWRRTEEFVDQEDYSVLDPMINFLSANGLEIRGHSVFYGDADSRPTWTDNLSDDELFQQMIQRAASITNRYEGQIASWDVNNETTKSDGGYFRDRFGDWIQTWMFTEVDQSDPNARLNTNEFGIIAGGNAIDAYKSYLDRIIFSGAPLDGIGVQGHFDYTASSWDIQKSLENFFGYNRPISITELDYSDPNEFRRAENLEIILRTLYSMPQVTDITLWGFLQDQMFEPNAHLWNRDGTTNAAGNMFKALLNEWTTEFNSVTNSSGRADFRGHHGEYTVIVRIPGTNQFVTQDIAIGPQASTQQVTVQLPIAVTPTGSTIQIAAAGATGSETMQLLIDGNVVQTFNNVGGSPATRSFQNFNYTHSSVVSADRLRVAFANDGNAINGNRDLRVDSIVLDGTRYQTEADSTLSTGTWNGNGFSPGFYQSEYLQGNGYFQYVANGLGSRISVRAAGSTNTETIQILIDGSVVRTINDVGGDAQRGIFQTYEYTHSGPIQPDQVRIQFVNDGNTSNGNRDVRIDSIAIDSTTLQTEANSTFSTGTWGPNGPLPGFYNSEWLHVNGYFQWG